MVLGKIRTQKLHADVWDPCGGRADNFMRGMGDISSHKLRAKILTFVEGVQTQRSCKTT